MSEKRRIEPGPPDGHAAYEHLVPLVEALIAHGNELAHPPTGGGVFSFNQGGPVAHLKKRIDWTWVQQNFELPELVRYDRRGDEIFDHRNWVSILGSAKERPWSRWLRARRTRRASA